MYLIYGKTDGKIWREVHQYETLPDGSIHAGMNGVNTLTYPPVVNVDVIEVMDEQWAAMDQAHLDKYKAQDGQVVDDPDGGASTEQEDTDAMLVDHEYRLTLLETGVN